MKLLLDENGNVVVRDGKPVYVHEDGKEIAFDAAAAMSKITALNTEAKDHRLKKNEALESLKAFEGIDLEEAKTAIETVKNFDATKLVDTGEVETLKRQMAETFDLEKKQITEQFRKERETMTADIGNKQATIFDLMVSQQFSKSPQFAGDEAKTILPPDMAAEYFGKNFKVEDDRVIGYLNGEKILSRENYGEPAGFEEALSVIIENYPMKDRITRSGKAGGPLVIGNTGNENGSKIIANNDQIAFGNNLEAIAKGEIKVA